MISNIVFPKMPCKPGNLEPLSHISHSDPARLSRNKLEQVSEFNSNWWIYLLVAWIGARYSHDSEMPQFASKLGSRRMLVLAACTQTTILDSVDVEGQAERVATVTTGLEGEVGC